MGPTIRRQSIHTELRVEELQSPVVRASPMQAKSLVCGPVSDDTKQTVRAEETAALSGSMEGLSITQLKRLIKSRGASHIDCLERTDLEARALQACQPAAE